LAKQLLEGDLIQISGGSIFEIKGLVHPPGKVISFPRFVLDLHGNRIHGKHAYKKIYSMSERFKFLEQNFPHYIVHDVVFDEKLCEVPLENVKHHYNPVNRLRQLRIGDRLDPLERDSLNFLEALKDRAGISWSKIGISGSLLVKLHTQTSDIDPIVYGSENCRKVYRALKSLTQDPKSNIKKYVRKELQKLHEFRVRDTAMSFENFVRTESRKVMQGKFKRRDYFMRCVKDWREIQEKYGSVKYKNVGYARIKAEIEDSSEAIFTPCSYKLKNVEILNGTKAYSIEEIASFRGRFCEQAAAGEIVIAQGKVERVTDEWQNREHFRLLLGNKPSDYMVLA
jgi:predicted nucleotidyltransferase